MKKCLICIAIMVSVLCGGNASATICPAGCFCLNNGEFNLSTNYQTSLQRTRIKNESH